MIPTTTTSWNGKKKGHTITWIIHWWCLLMIHHQSILMLWYMPIKIVYANYIWLPMMCWMRAGMHNYLTPVYPRVEYILIDTHPPSILITSLFVSPTYLYVDCLSFCANPTSFFVPPLMYHLPPPRYASYLYFDCLPLCTSPTTIALCDNCYFVGESSTARCIPVRTQFCAHEFACQVVLWLW